MVALLSSSKDLRRAVLYNERKVETGAAVLLDAGYFLEDLNDLSFQRKLDRFEGRMQLNSRSRSVIMLMSLNFANSDRLTSSDLKQVTAEFLRKIGFENQPYLLYEHHDTGHRHVHVVSTLIRADGSRIDIGRLTIKHIKKACRELENEFELARYGIKTGVKKTDGSQISLLNGKQQTVDIINSWVKKVHAEYTFTNLNEYNAILSQFGVRVLRGKPTSRLYQYGGLMYCLTTASGAQKSAPIKASRLKGPYTLIKLQKIFAANKPAQLLALPRLKNTLDLALRSDDSFSLKTLAEALSDKGVKIHIRKDQDSMALTYVDNRTRCAFDQKLLGNGYGLNDLDQRCKQAMISGRPLHPEPERIFQHQDTNAAVLDSPNFRGMPAGKKNYDMLLHDLLAALPDHSVDPFTRRRAKKSKRNAVYL